jgi:hypothetical protein
MITPSNMRLSRRSLIVGLGASVACAGAASAQASSFARISVDVSELQRRGLGPYADFVRSNLARAMAQHFAGRTGGGGPGLTVSVSDVTLSGFAGGRSADGGGWRDGGGSGGGATDYMEGTAVISNGRSVLRRYPQLVALPSNYAGADYLQGIELRRTAALCDAYASWLARAL